MKKYQIIYADPPWKYGVWYQSEDIKRNAADHYTVMKTDDIINLPVNTIASENSLLFMWVTFPCLPDGLEIIKKWGFKYSTCAFVWIKANKRVDLDQTSFLPHEAIDDFTGLGNYTRANAEICLLAKKGTFGKGWRYSKSVRQIIYSPIEEHSKKPDEARKRIVQLCGDLSRIELFARQKTEGWDVWGNEVESDIEL